MCALAFFVRDLGIVQARCARSSSSQVDRATSSRRWPVSAKNSTMPPYGPLILRAARMTWASSLSSRTRSRATSFRGQRHAFGRGLIEDSPSHAPAEERLDRFQGLVGGDGGAALFDRGDTSTTSRLLISWMLLPVQARRSLDGAA